MLFRNHPDSFRSVAATLRCPEVPRHFLWTLLTTSVRSNRPIARSVGGDVRVSRANEEQATPAAQIAPRAEWPRERGSIATVCVLSVHHWQGITNFRGILFEPQFFLKTLESLVCSTQHQTLS